MVIIDSKAPLPEDRVPTDAPPSYDALDTPSRARGYLPEKPPVSPGSSSFTQSSSPLHPAASGSTTPISANAAGKRPMQGPRYSSWFGFGASKTTREVRSTVIGLVRDLVRVDLTSSDDHSGGAILSSCEEACKAYALSLSSVLQEKSIEGHTPIHWAIIKRPAEPVNSNDYDLVTALLSHSSPLTSSTVSDIRLACLMNSDHALFQRLRMSPVFSPMSGSDEILLGGGIPQDTIDVKDVDDDASAFVMHCSIMAFQKRMRVSKKIQLEFIAKGRMWRLAFSIAPSSKWTVSLAILEHSPPTWIDSRLLIEEPPQYVTGPAGATSWFSRPTSPDETSEDGANVLRKPKSTISLRLKAGRDQLTAPTPRYPHTGGEITLEFDDSLTASSLQYDGCTYYTPDGTLNARLEARLAKPEADCVIC
ncbi:hypothetical protein FIBSPDRAFT_917664 [Athelia psychrophila]|uniref:Uncharacterized protein n=1 Tax=Athelia psychrophila TaxID=1759441 RepID=A0A166RMM3_9AGAM|nr:hypothetical protein FIBSPDRAFT_917664 [Fibularhizoctonia sp. CBS 109695]